MDKMQTVTNIEERRRRRAEGLALHAIEGVPFSEDEIAFLERLDNLGLTNEQRIEAIKARYAFPVSDAAE